ncbi:MAG: DUF819 family protein [Woeseiaceae bacterium]|nr:DUF819 family protein [Woeseiaceae bacterium]
MTSLISADNDFAVWAVLIGLAAFGFWCERYPFGRRFSGVMLLISLAIILSNLRIIPTQAPAYDTVWNFLVPVAIALLLFQADLKRIFTEAGKTLIAFVIGAAAVVAGVFVAVALVDVSPDEDKLAGIFAGTYIGGSLNFTAIATASEFPDQSRLSAAFAADNLITNLHLIAIVLLPGLAWVARLFPDTQEEPIVGEPAANDEPVHRIADLDVAGLLLAVALAFVLAAAGRWLGDLVERPHYAILITTALAVGVATFARRQVDIALSGYNEAGTALLFVFLASIGASADVWRLVETAPILFLFALIVVSVHLLLLFTIGRFARLSLGELCVASAVCIGGPAMGPAVASARGWHALVIPGVLAGSFGYAIGSFVGISVWEWLRVS